MVEQAILAVLSLIEGILPLVTGTQSANTVQIIDKVIAAIEGLLPQIITWSQTLYIVASNILSTLLNSGTLTPAQIASTQALQAQVDAGWNAVVNNIDPDNPANVGTAAGDPGTSAT